MKSKSVLLLLMQTCFSFVIQSQSIGDNNIEFLDKIVNEAVDHVAHYIECKTNLEEKIPPASFFVYLRDQKQNGNYVFSVEPFPVDIRSIQSLEMLGYYRHNNHLIFIATEKDAAISYPNLLHDCLNIVVDSLLNRYSSRRNISVVLYYYYLFEFKYKPLFNKKVILHYNFYPDFGLVPEDKKGAESVFENTWVKFLDYRHQGSIFFNCADGKLSDGEKGIFKKGLIKVNLKQKLTPRSRQVCCE